MRTRLKGVKKSEILRMSLMDVPLQPCDSKHSPLSETAHISGAEGAVGATASDDARKLDEDLAEHKKIQAASREVCDKISKRVRYFRAYKIIPIRTKLLFLTGHHARISQRFSAAMECGTSHGHHKWQEIRERVFLRATTCGNVGLLLQLSENIERYAWKLKTFALFQFRDNSKKPELVRLRSFIGLRSWHCL